MKIKSIQYLRAMAALAVVVHHASLTLLPDHPMIPFSQGAYGVDLFFVISGFIMYYTTKSSSVTLSVFYTRRIIRIVPIYFILTTVAFAIAISVPHYTVNFTSNPMDYLRSILFVPYIDKRSGLMRPELGQGWTLNYEMFFYFIFGLVIFVSRRWRALLCGLAIGTLVLVGACLGPKSVIIATYTSSLLLEFLIGVLIGWSFECGRIGYSALFLFGLMIVAVVWRAAGLPILPAIIPGALFGAGLGGCLWLERRGRVFDNSFLILIGDASYSLYLFHTFALAGIKRVWMTLFDPHNILSHVSIIIVGSVVAVVVSLMFYKYIEEPITIYLTRIASPSRRANSVA